MKMKRLLTLLLCGLLVLGVWPALAEATPAPEPEAETEEVLEGNFFAAMELTYLDGTPFDASVFEGKPIFLNIWATWCSPCLMEMPHLNELAEEYKDKIHIIGVHAEGMTVTEEGELLPVEEKNTLAMQLRDEKGLTYPLLNPDITLFILMNNPQYGLQVSALPTTWFIDDQGFIRDVVPGYKDKAGWQQAIDAFLEYVETEVTDEPDVS